MNINPFGMEQLFNHLNSIYPLTDKLAAYLATNLKTRNLKKKEFLLKQGHVSRDICFIDQGLLRCFYLIEDKEVCAWFMKEGDVVISVESFFYQTKSYQSIQALNDSLLYYITYDELQYCFRNFPEFNIIGRVLTERYYALSEQRLYSLRMQRAPDRYNYLMKYHSELIQRVPSKYLASYLGIAEVTLSNIKGQLQIS